MATEPAALAELLAHARALVGARLADLADALGLPVPLGHATTKGWSGQIIERELGADQGSRAGPDFAALGVELKTVPVNAVLLPRESTAVCAIDPVAIAAESWETSAVRRKLERVLWIALAVSPGGDVGDRRVAGVRLWSPDAEQDALLRGDFETIVRGYFRRGRGDELSGRVGRVLHVRPKGRDAGDRRAAFDAAGRPAAVLRRGFYLRPAFVASILRPAGACLDP